MPLLDWSFRRVNRIRYSRCYMSSTAWLRVPELIRFRLCVLVYRCLHGTAPTYLADSLRRTADVDGRRRLYALPSQTRWSRHRRTVQHSATRDRAFPVAASRAWNGLPSSVTAASSLSTFRQERKTLAYSSGRIFGRSSFLTLYLARLLHIILLTL